MVSGGIGEICTGDQIARTESECQSSREFDQRIKFHCERMREHCSILRDLVDYRPGLGDFFFMGILILPGHWTNRRMDCAQVVGIASVALSRSTVRNDRFHWCRDTCITQMDNTKSDERSDCSSGVSNVSRNGLLLCSGDFGILVGAWSEWSVAFVKQSL